MSETPRSENKPPNDGLHSTSKLKPPTSVKRPLSVQNNFDDSLKATKKPALGDGVFISGKDCTFDDPLPGGITTSRRQTVAVSMAKFTAPKKPATKAVPALPSLKVGPPASSSEARNLRKSISMSSMKLQEPGTSSSEPSMTSNKPSLPKLPGKKRAAWDYKGRLEDMEGLCKTAFSQLNQQSEQLEATTNRVCALETVKNSLETHVKVKDSEMSEACRKINKLSEDTMMLEQEKARLQLQLETVTESKEALQRSLGSAQNEIITLRDVINRLTADSLSVTTELRLVQGQLEKALSDIDSKASKILVLTQELDVYRDKLLREEGLRRKLHNTILELKGNIRVFCRLRPPLPSELESTRPFYKVDHDVVQGSITVSSTVAVESATGGKRGTTSHEFTFDRVFLPEHTQKDVFGEISQLVQSALDGYHVCIFAYGQTGSGKTFTMEGPINGDLELRGMIPRAVDQIFEVISSLKEKGWQYNVEASFLEIYNETIRDLLGDNDPNIKHDIKLASSSSLEGPEIIVTNITTVPVTTLNQVAHLLEKASHNRSVAATNCNEHSSRSHSVFRLKIRGLNATLEENCQGMLNLVDLAGSERLKQSGSEGDRLKETQAINKSLSTLGQVISALSNKEQHVPYRNSKLTHLLQSSLGGNSKTLMFVNISPLEESFGEALCSLRFASKVNQCNIGTAVQKKSVQM